MELQSEIIHTAPRQAATVVMLRDGPAGLEVFLIKRHGLSDVMGGAYVFPGGKLDASDAELGETFLDQTPPALHAKLGEPDLDVATAAGLYVAALREAYEESGVLFAHSSAGSTLPVCNEAPGFNAMLTTRGLQLQTQAVIPWSRWITPRMPSVGSKRFDTRFFISAVPAGQTALHDNHEATDSTWLSPRAALEQYWEYHIELAPPQIMSLSHLSRFPDVASALDAAKKQLPPTIFPEAFDKNGERVICYPGDPEHSVAQRALPGPTRLLYRNRRFEPSDGFEALFN
jgi:8-oxo-dGTP pyrophosphatase MutT (NUDIX family)